MRSLYRDRRFVVCGAVLLSLLEFSWDKADAAGPPHQRPECSSPPTALFVMASKPAGNIARLTWESIAPIYTDDVVRGGLLALRANGGSFELSVHHCGANDLVTALFDDPGIPVSGDGYWYLLRRDQIEGCPSWGGTTYNDLLGSRQVGDRNVIQSLPEDCNCYWYCCSTFNVCEW